MGPEDMNEQEVMKDKPGRLTIGRVAKLSGVGVETIRYYQREGILKEPARSESGTFREYSVDVIRRIRFIKRAQELGFSLREIVELLNLRSSGRSTCGTVKERASLKILEVDQKIEDLQRIRAALANVKRVCSRSQPTTSCPILEEFYLGNASKS
jgi:MerR family transcriptional regulator, copper efflux regulator